MDASESVCVGWVRVRVCVCLSVCVSGIATHDLFLSSETKALFTFSV